mgnify:CR=1 FL=1
MNYRPLKNYQIKIEAKKEVEYNAGTGTILIPPADTRIFLHWLNDNGKLTSTFTLTYATLVDRKSTRLNSSHVSESRMPSSA